VSMWDSDEEYFLCLFDKKVAINAVENQSKINAQSPTGMNIASDNVYMSMVAFFGSDISLKYVVNSSRFALSKCLVFLDAEDNAVCEYGYESLTTLHPCEV